MLPIFIAEIVQRCLSNCNGEAGDTVGALPASELLKRLQDRNWASLRDGACVVRDKVRMLRYKRCCVRHLDNSAVGYYKLFAGIHVAELDVVALYVLRQQSNSRCLSDGITK